MNGLKLFLYNKIGYLIALLFGQKGAKYFFEHQYWRFKWIMEGRRFSNDHYQWVFEAGFGLDHQYYEGKKVMDIGCGPRGSLEWVPESTLAYGLDPLANDYLKLSKGKHRMTYVSAGAEAIPFENDYFDVVSSFNSLDHVDDLEASLKEIYRILKPGGDFLLITDIHEKPALCEPIAIDWNISDHLAVNFSRRFEKRLKRRSKIYESIRHAEAYDGQEYGILMGHFVKK